MATHNRSLPAAIEVAKPISQENQVFLNIARLISRNEPFIELEDLDLNVEWGSVISAASRHKMLPLVADVLLNSKRIRRILYENQLYIVLLDVIEANRIRTILRKAITVEVQESLEHAAIKCLSRKGCVYDHLLYGGHGLRRSNDIDLFIEPENKSTAEVVLKERGFCFDYIDPITGFVDPTVKKNYMGYRIFPDRIPPMMRKCHNVFQRSIKIDIAFDFAWYGSPIATASNSLLRKAFLLKQKDRTTGLATAPNWINFLDCVLDLYQSAYYEKNLMVFSFNGVSLQRFVDVARWWVVLTDSDKEKIRNISDPGIVSIIQWVLYHTDEVLLTKIGHEVDAYSRNKDDYYNWQKGDGTSKRWHGSMLNRLFSDDKEAIFGI